MKVILGGNQMSLIRDTEEVVKFLEFAARKSILNDHAVTCRMTACNNLFALVNEEEDNVDYLLNNLDLLVNRFRNKSKTTNDSTLKVYKSRVKSSLEDYRAWSTDPFAWERSLSEKQKQNSVEKRAKKSLPVEKKTAKPAPKEKKAVSQKPVPTPKEISVPVGSETKLSLPLRPGATVHITLPADGITLKEFHRLGMFLYPLCKDIEFGDSNWNQLQN